MADDLSQQAASQQSPGAPVPLPINPAQAVMGIPPQTQSAAPTGAPQQQTTAVQTQPSPDQQVQAHHSALGATVRHIFDSLEGRQTVYQPQADGTVSPVSVQRKPGAFFRDLVGGVMAGMATSSAPTEHPSGAAGLGRGFLGAQDYLQNQQQGRKAAAQETATAQKALNDRQLAAASAAHDTVSSLDLGHNLNFHNPNELNQYNASVNAVKDQAMKVGGQLVNLPNGVENGKVGNGPALMAAINQDPSLMQAPEGYHRVPFIIHDPGELEHDGANWQGKADWNGQATVYLVDIPNESWGKPVSLPNKTWNAAAGRQLTKGDPNANATSTFARCSLLVSRTNRI